MDIAMRQEQHFLNNRSYGTTLASLGLPDPYYVDKTASAVAKENDSRVYQITPQGVKYLTFWEGQKG